jgi:hypothetical protein
VADEARQRLRQVVSSLGPRRRGGARGNHRQREPVAAAGARRDRAGAERLAQRGDLHLQVVLLDDDVGPHLGDQVVLGDELAGARDQRAQHVERAAAQRDGPSVRAEKLALRGAEVEVAEAVAGGHAANLPRPRTGARGIQNV